MTRPTCHGTDGQWLVNQVKGQSTRISSRKSKCNAKILKIYIASWKPKIQRWLEDRELNQTRSKPDPADGLVRTAHIIVRHCNGTQYFSAKTVMILFPVLQTNITPQMWTCGSKEAKVYTKELQQWQKSLYVSCQQQRYAMLQTWKQTYLICKRDAEIIGCYNLRWKNPVSVRSGNHWTT